MKQLQWRLSCAVIVNFKRGGPSAKLDFNDADVPIKCNAF